MERGSLRQRMTEKWRDAEMLEGLDGLRADEPGEPKPPNKEQPASGNLDQQNTMKGRKKQ